MRPTRRDHDAPVICNCVDQQVDEQKVPEIIGGERLLIAIDAVRNGAVKLRARIAYDCLEGVDLAASGQNLTLGALV